MRLFTASLATESNSFSPIPTNRASYEAAFYYPPGQHPDVPRHVIEDGVELSGCATREANPHRR